MSRKLKGRKLNRNRGLRSGLARALRLQALESRQLMAVNVLDDSVSLVTDASINVLTNDTSGNEVQSVSAFNADFTNPNPSGNDTDWFIPDRPGQPGVPQRSLIPGAVMFNDNRADGFNGGANYGDIDLLRDTDSDPSNDSLLTAADALDASEGIGLPILRDNSPVDSTLVNLGVPQFATEGGGPVFIAIAAGPENAGELSAKVSNAFFPYEAGWVGGAFDSAGNPTAVSDADGDTIADITVTGSGGIFTATVAGVSDSFNDGFLFSVGGDNEDNYSRTRPLGGGDWAVQLRDNSAQINGAEADDINLLYIPRSTQGLIGGVVDASSDDVNPMIQSFGDFTVSRESDGFWRLNVPGQDITSGVLIMESYDLTDSRPRNAYFTYDVASDDPNDIIIRQFEWTANDLEVPLNTDFMFFFIPFENTLSPAHDLTVTSLGTAAAPTSGLSEKGLALSVNPDGTVNYQTNGAISALPAGATDTDSFVYTATDGVDSATATVTVTWIGENDAPSIIGSIPDQTFNEDDAPVIFDLTTIFEDVDLGDTLTYSFDPGLGGLVSMSVTGDDLSVAPTPDSFGFTRVSVTATDTFGASATIMFSISVVPQDDDVVAVDDAALTDKVTPVDVAVLANDYHPDTSMFSVAAAEIFVDSAATSNAASVWTVVNSTAGPNELTIQSAGNVGDVAVGRNGVNLFQSDGVFLGTVREDLSPWATVNAYSAFSSYGFATELGAGGNGERNAPLSAAFFPFAEAWTSGHVTSEGTLVGGVGVSSGDIVKLGTGLYEITIPEATVAAQDGMLFVIGGTNNDNIMSVTPSDFDNKWLVRQLDNDGAEDAFEDAAWSFVYVPGTTAGLIGGRYGGFEEDRGLKQSYGSISVAEDINGQLTVSIAGFTPADGALIAISSGSESTLVNGSPLTIPKNDTVIASPLGNDFFVQALSSGTFTQTAADVQFIFLPYATPLERFDGLDFSISSFDATSALGATITLNVDGTLNYDPTTGGPDIQNLGNGESTQDTFTYTIQDGRGGVSTATVTVTVQGENQAPTANNDTINLNEITASAALLTVLGNDTDPDLAVVLGTPQGTTAGNLAVDGSSVWSVAGTGAAPNAITLGAGTTGDVEVLRDGNPIAPADGIVIAAIRENATGDATTHRLVQAYANGSGGTSLALRSFGVDGAADAPVGVTYFPFADNWVGGHVDAGGTLTTGNGVAASNVARTGTGRYSIVIPGLTDAAVDGFLFVIGNENGDNYVSSRAVTGTNTYEVAVRDNLQDFGAGEDGGFSFVFVPRNAENLVAGVVDAASPAMNPLSLTVGEFTMERLEVAAGQYEWKLTIPGQSPDTGVLILANQDNNELEDNHLTYQSDGAGSFLIRSHDAIGMGLQNQPFTFAFVPFDNPGRPVFRPVPDLLVVTAVDATSALGVPLSINADGTINYAAGDQFLTMYSGDSMVDSFSYTMGDGFGGTSSATVTINIAGFGEAPAISTSAGATYYGLGDSPIGIDRFADLVEIGTPNLDGAVLTVEITAGGLASDELSVRNDGVGSGQIGLSGTDVTFEGTVIGTVAGGTNLAPLTVTLNSDATGASADALLRALTFGNFNSATGEGARGVTLSIVDGAGREGGSAVKGLSLGILRTRDLQAGVDYGYGAYTGARDAQIRQNAPDSVINPAEDFLIDFDNGTVNSQGLLKFGNLFGNGPGQIPLGAIITSAELIVETNPNTPNAPGDGGTFHRMLQDWDDATATWNSFGDGLQKDDVEARSVFESQIGTASSAGATGTGFLSFSVLPDVRAWAAGEANYGWAIIGWDGNTDGWFFSSSEDETPTARPRLKIEWLPAATYDSVSFQEGVNGYTGTVDTVIRADAPDTDNSVVETLFVDAPTTENHALVRFEDIFGDGPGQIPLGSKIITARLTTASTSSNAMGDGGQFYPMLADWNDTDTWNTLDAGISPDGVEAADYFNTQAGNATLNPDVQGGFNAWDVTADLQDWANGVIANKGWAIIPWVNGTNGWGFQSSEAPVLTERPRLEVYFTEATNSAPTDIVIDNSMVAENTDTTGGLVIGNLSAVDPDAGDSHTFVLVSGSGDSDLFSIAGNVLSINDGEVLDFETKASYVVRVRTTDAGGLQFERDLTIEVIDRGEIEAIVIGDGTAQRSRVDSVTVEFDSEVTIEPGAFEVTQRGASGGPVDVGFTSSVVNGKTVAVLTFSGALTEFGSLADGNYDLRIVGSLITDALGNAFDGDADGAVGGDRLFGTDEADAFYRLFGETGGDRTVGFADFVQFRNAFGSTAGGASYVENLDFDDDGVIGFVDFVQFRNRFGQSLPFE